MKHMQQRIVCVFLSAVLGMCAPLPVIASDIGLGNDYERLIQYEEAAKKQTRGEDGEEQQQEEISKEQKTQEEVSKEQAQGEEGKKKQEEKAGGKDTVSAPSAILIETSTGQVIYEKDADAKRPPASVTKVMTLLLIFDALNEGKIKLEDEVTTSEYAASMGGSQVFLEPGETQTVDTMIKCISVASANDACVAMAEFVCGSEEEFVAKMNERAKGLGMENTHFENCNGLDTDGHLTTAKDIALMSKELITKYPQIHDYCMIWMENITHETKKGTTEFGLSNTNKLIRHYEYATGLKTGSTSKAKFCISATAKKDDMELIAVIMAANDSKARNKDAITLFNYGFGKCQKYTESELKPVKPIKVKQGVKENVSVTQKTPFSYVDATGADLNTIERKVTVKKSLNAPVKKGKKVGEAEYYLGGVKIGSIDVVTKEAVQKVSYKSAMGDVIEKMLL